MPPTTAQHPSPAELSAFALGKLDASMTEWVGRHLADCSTCRTAVEQTPADSLVNRFAAGPAGATGPWVSVAETRSGAPPPPPIAPEDVPPALRDHSRYRLIRRIGEGGMGAVYLAEHRVMERVVAIKVINRAFVAHPEAVERFTREIKAVAKLDHPNIAKAYDAEQAGELQLLAMEYVEGKSLADVLAKKGPLPIPNACHYVRQAALGLQHAFERGMVHRDLKPQNLMLTPQGVVKVLDFGLAKLASESAKPGGGLTQDNMMMGTPQYMAPEQAVNTKGADIRADIYALGCTLYCLLTGRPPFAGDSLAVIVAHATDAPTPVESLRPEVPPELAALVQRLLAKNANDRPQTPKELAAALLPFVKAMPKATTQPPKPSPPKNGDPFVGLAARPRRRASRSAARRRWLIPTAMAAGVLFLVTAIAAIIVTVRTPDGIVTVQVDPPDAKVEVAEGAITILPRGENEPYTITVPKAGGKLRISKPGFVVVAKEVTLSDKGAPITVKLEPVPPPRKPTEPPVPADGFVPLFNGKDKTGWVLHPSQWGDWRVEDGALTGSGTASHLFTERGDFKDFHLRAEVRVNEDGNSGIYFRTPFGLPRLNNRIPGGYEAKILHRYDKAAFLTGSLQGFVMAPNLALAADEWFTMEIIAVGNELTVKVNNETTAHYVDEKRTSMQGHFALQVWNPATTAVQFRKIEIKELPPGAAGAGTGPAAVPPPTPPPPAPTDKTLTVDLGGGVPMKFVRIPAGMFTMGSPKSEQDYVTRTYYTGKRPDWLDTETQHEVTISRPFYMGSYTVTVGQFSQFVREAGYKTDAESSGQGSRPAGVTDAKMNRNLNWHNPGFAQTGDDPVTCVSWNDAVKFVEWLSQRDRHKYRLPTDAEWEYSCRGGRPPNQPFGIGDGRSLSSTEANFNGLKAYGGAAFGPFLGGTCPVGQFQPNGWGLHNMHGNVWQWCSDWFGSYPSGSVTDPAGPDRGTGRALRGGSWHNPAWYCRAAFRGEDEPETRRPTIGFRVARDASDQDK